MIKKILVTGSSGTIGTRLCEILLSKGYEVSGADWNQNKWSAAVQSATVDVDLRDEAAVFEKLPRDADLVIHLAANARVHDLVVDPERARDNIDSTFNVLEFCRRNEIRRFAFASSREVYGNTAEYVHKESDATVAMAESPYTASKVAGESMTWAYQRCYGLDIVIFRFSNVYGMYDESNRFVPLMIRRAAKGEDLAIFGKDKLLDFTYIDDCVNGIMLTIAKFDGLKQDVYNIACGEGAKLGEVAEMIRQGMKSDSKIVFGESRTGEVLQYVADIGKAKSKICYEPVTPIREGIRKSVEWYRQRLNL